MKHHGIITAIVGSAAIVHATSHSDPINVRTEVREGYTVQPLVWRGAIEENGPEVSFNGTIEEITQQIRAIKRDFTWESLPKPSNNRLNERSKAGIICGVGGESASNQGPYTTNVEDSRDKVAAMTGTFSVGAGPGVCSRITCTRNAAVWLCNDNHSPIAPPTNSLASYVTDIIEKCGQDYYHGARYCRGQEFDSGNFNVIVGWADHC